MKEKDLKTAYGEPTAGFHHSVMNAVYHLDDKKAVTHSRKSRIMKVGLVCAMVAAFGTFTVAATATNFFGLFAQPVGQYGMNIATNESSVPDEEEFTDDDFEDDFMENAFNCSITLNYLPDGFVPRYGTGYAGAFLDDNYFSKSWYLEISAYQADTYHSMEYSIVKSEETEFGGHRAIINTKKRSETSDHISYVVTEYFDNEGIVLRCEFIGEAPNQNYYEPDYEEMLRIMNGVTIEMNQNSQTSTRDRDYEPGPASNHFPTDLIRMGKDENGTIGQAYTTTAADYDAEEAELTIKVASITEQDTAEGMSKDDFLSAGRGISLYDKYFDENGKFISQGTFNRIEQFGDGVNSLSQTQEVTFTRKFYIVRLEVTADKDIEDIYKVMSLDVFGLDDEGDAYKATENGGEIEIIGVTDVNKDDTIGIEKDKTAVIDCAFIADASAEDETVFSVTTANGVTDDVSIRLFSIKK